MKPSVSFEVPVLVVGNLSVGGTGKTPMIEYLIRLLEGKKLATLSRGYRRATKGFRIATDQDTSQTVGDEPFQIYRKFGDRVTVCVGEDRALAIAQLMDHHPDTELVLLDDGFQHRRVRPSFSVLLTEYAHPFYKDSLLPGGRLRESRHGARRADVVVVTKCPTGITQGVMKNMESEIRCYTQSPVFFSSIWYDLPVPFGLDKKISKEIILVTGIANVDPIIEYLQDKHEVIYHFRYADHYNFSSKDIIQWTRKADNDYAILTTEKDMVRLLQVDLRNDISSLPIFYLPIKHHFIKSGKEFDALIHAVLAQNSQTGNHELLS